jgi:hypothetical protein
MLLAGQEAVCWMEDGSVRASVPACCEELQRIPLIPQSRMEKEDSKEKHKNNIITPCS